MIIKHRDLLPSQLRITGIGVELGVAAGDYSWTILDTTSLDHLFSIDIWEDEHHVDEYELVCKKAIEYDGRCTVLKMLFQDAVKLFKDETFDFVYVDGYAHLGQENGGTLRDWWPKVKLGGIFSGHDYAKRYVETIQAVDSFVSGKRLELNLTTDDEFPSWWIIKP